MLLPELEACCVTDILNYIHCVACLFRTRLFFLQKRGKSICPRLSAILIFPTASANFSHDPDNFNCLFCYCPLYVLGERCGGSFTYLENGYKDCRRCLYPHDRGSYDAIMKRYGEILAVMASRRKEENQ